MTIISATEARANFQSIISRAEYKGERILIQRHGKPVVVKLAVETAPTQAKSAYAD